MTAPAEPLAVAPPAPLTVAESAAWLRRVNPVRVREACGIRRATVAAALGVDRSSVYDWETGRRWPLGPAGAAYCRVIAGLLRHLEVPE